MKCLLIIIAALLPMQLLAEDNVIHIYQDADISHHDEFPSAFLLGIEIAFDELGSENERFNIVYKYLDQLGPMGDVVISQN